MRGSFFAEKTYSFMTREYIKDLDEELKELKAKGEA
jgi:hypothetical protein